MKKSYLKALPLMAIALISGIATAIVEGFLNLHIKGIIDIAFYRNGEGFMGEVAIISILAVGVLVTNTILSVLKGFYRRDANLRLKKDYLQRVFRKNINEFNNESSASYVSNITNDMNTIDTNFIDALFELSLAFASFFVFAVIIAGVSGRILILIIGLTVFMGVLSSVVSKPLKKLYGERSKLYEGYTTYTSEVLNAFRIVRANNLYEKVTEDFGKRSRKLQEKSFQIDKYSTYIYAFQNGTMNLVFMGIIATSVYFAIKGEITLGGVILVVNNSERMIRPLQMAGELYPKIISSKPLFSSLEGSLKNSSENPETDNIDAFNETIDIRQARFAYGDNEVFNNLDLSFRKGGKYLVVGPSGGGKSTLLRLLRKYFYVDEGDILVDGMKLKGIRKDSWFRRIANVEQRIFIFDDTLRNNLTLYREAGTDDIESAAKAAGLSDFLSNLPDGLDTVLEDNGRNISGGEKSRIALARALLSKSDILLLDEAFASLDYNTARDIERTILMIEDLTVINVSHVVIDENKSLYDDIIRVSGKGASSVLDKSGRTSLA